MWAIVDNHYQAVLAFRDELDEFENKQQQELDEVLFFHKLLGIWDQLNHLAHSYEEVCREWCLPTYLAQLISYPDTPNEIKKTS